MKEEKQISEIFKGSWKLFKENYVTLILATIVACLMSLLVVTIPPMIFGLYFICAQLMNGKKIKITDVFKGFDYFFRSWWLMILGLLAVCVGLVVLVVPGILLIILFQFAIAVSIIENRTAYDSLRRSYDLAKNNFALSIVFLIFVSFLNGLGSATHAGFILTVPFTTLCACLAVKLLTKKK